MHFTPISALHGDNVVDRSEHMDWYEGATLLHLLENVHIGAITITLIAAFLYSSSSVLKARIIPIIEGMQVAFQEVFLNPEMRSWFYSGFSSKIKSIDTMNGGVDEVCPHVSKHVT